MGYLAVMAGSFVGGLVLTSVVLGALAHYFLGTVPEWTLLASLFVAFCGSVAATHWYEDRPRTWSPRR